MLAALVILAALLYFPALRHAVGEFVWWALALVSLTLLLGAAGPWVWCGLLVLAVALKPRPKPRPRHYVAPPQAKYSDRR
jgi:hypothetical protein